MVNKKREVIPKLYYKVEWFSFSKNIKKMNYNRSIKRQIELNANPEKVWSIISKKSNLELFHPFCLKNPTIEWIDNSHKDTIYY